MVGNAEIQSFAALAKIPWLLHGFISRIPGIEVHVERSQALERLRSKHEILLKSFQIDSNRLHTAEQVHGNQIAFIRKNDLSKTSPGADGLVTNEVQTPIGIYVADCCAIYLVDLKTRSLGLFHSGKKGTEANIAAEGIFALRNHCGSEPSEMVAVLSPCIHSCCYEVDFVSEIENQLRKQGVTQVTRIPECTSCHVERYYSYRKEHGKTGRMLAFMMKRD